MLSAVMLSVVAPWSLSLFVGTLVDSTFKTFSPLFQFYLGPVLYILDSSGA
jgi:hypothetical protein